MGSSYVTVILYLPQNKRITKKINYTSPHGAGEFFRTAAEPINHKLSDTHYFVF